MTVEGRSDDQSGRIREGRISEGLLYVHTYI